MSDTKTTPTSVRTGSSRSRRRAAGRRDDGVTSMLGRRRRQRRVRVRLILALLLTLALVGGGLWLVQFSSVLTARQVSVSKTSYLSRDQVVAAARVPLGVPLADQDLAAIGQRVGALAPVAEVTVTRSWPTTVRIQVTERKPAFALDTGSGFSLVDRSGIMFAPVPEIPKGLLKGQSSTTDSRQLSDMAIVVAALPKDLRERTQSIKADSPDSIRLNLTKGDSVIWGSAEDAEIKGEVTLALLKRQGSVYNVTVPAHPTVR